MQIKVDDAVYALLAMSLLLLMGCDSSGSSDSPDSVAGTWTGSRSLSAEVDTVDGNGNSVTYTGQLTRKYELVIAESGSELSVEITVEQSGEADRIASRRGTENLDGSLSYSAGGTYGPPTLVVTDVAKDNYPINIRTDRWKFEVENGTATDSLGITLLPTRLPTSWIEAIKSQAESTPLILKKQ